MQASYYNNNYLLKYMSNLDNKLDICMHCVGALQ